MIAPIISNSSPIIALDRIGQLELLHALFTEIWIPQAVLLETGTRTSLPEWIVERSLSQPIGPHILGASLGPGESEAISLALEVGAQYILLDDLAARRTAQTLGLSVLGILGILLVAKRRGILKAVSPCMESLLANEFRIAPSLYTRVLVEAGEETRILS